MARSEHVSWRFGVPPDGRPRVAGDGVTCRSSRAGWAPNYGPVRPATPKCKADADGGIAPKRISAFSAKMSLETLLEAARYLEYTARAQTRGEIPKDFGAFTSASPPASPPPPTAPSTPPPTPLLILREDSSVAGSSQTAAAQELRRRVGSGTREVHNKLEKNRRAHLKECFELLKKQLPAAQDEKKSSNLSILHSALRYIQSLKRKERDYEHEMERLAREKIASQQRLSALKKELSAQWDHIDFNALLPTDSMLPEIERIKSRTSNSTSTASEQGHMSEDAEDVAFPLHPCDKCHIGSTPQSSPVGRQSPLQQHDATEIVRGAPPGLATAVVSPVHITSNHQRPCQTAPSPKSPILPSSPLLLASQQPLALTVQHHHSSIVLPHSKCHEHDAKMVAVSTSASVTVPTIHLASGQHPVAYLSPPSAQGELSHEGAIAASRKFGSHHLSPAVAITGGSIALSNGVVASAAVSLASSQSARPITLAHSPTSGGTSAMLSTGIHGAGSAPALPTHLTPAGIAHLVAPIGGGHAALVTASGAATHSLMTPLALVSSTGRPVAAHILGTSTSAPGPVAGKVMTSGATGALPLLKPVAVGGQLPIMNAQYLTTATALGGLAHLVKPLVVVSSAASNHSSNSKLPSSPPQ